MRIIDKSWTRSVIGAVAVLILSQSAATQQPVSTRYPPPGKLVDVGGWRLHVHCTGENKQNTPTVVLESGFLGFSFDWSLVQPEVARFTRVCSYDRAGHAWSDPGPRPRTMRQSAHELHKALANLGISPPYVLVGHSLGGLLVRTFASQYPQEVVGMVLVDSAHEDAQRNFKGRIVRIREMSQGRAIPPIQTSIAAADKALTAEERQKIEEALKQEGPAKIEPPYNRLAPQTQQVWLWAMAQPERYEAGKEPYAEEEFAEMYSARKTRERPLGDIPLIVLTRGNREPYSEEEKRMQADLLNLSRNSKQIIAEGSGHHIQLDEPTLVTGAIREVVDSARHQRKVRSPR
jgi:pimeloyl-ACP methyl ester carboxylesterase